MSEQDRLVMIQRDLWWNFERWMRIHGYAQTPITGTEITYVHKPGTAPPQSEQDAPGEPDGGGCLNC